MAQYYDPREASTTFSLYAKATQTQREEEEAASKKKASTAKGLMTPWKMLEAKRAGDITEATQLLSERDSLTTTGRKYKSAEYVAPERKEYDPRRLKDWLGKRYGRSGEERVTREAIVSPGDKKISEEFESGVPVSMSTPEGNQAHMQKMRNEAYDRDFSTQALEQKDSQNLETIQNRWNLGKQGNLGSVKGMQLPDASERDLDQIEMETYKKEYDRLKGMPKSEMELELGITDPTPPPPLGDVSSNVNFLPQRPGNLMEQAQAGLTGNVPPPQVDPSKFVGRYDLSKDLETARTYQSASQGFGEAAEKQGRLQEVLEGRQKQSPIPGNKVITQAPSNQPISSLLGKKGLLDESVSQEYGSFNELVSARNAARGTEGLGAIQEQVSQYMPKGTSYGEASKAFDAAKTTAETAAAVETGGEVIGAAGETAGGFTPGIGEALAVKEVGEIWGESGGRGEDKIKATGGTAADLASSYAIASGNPYAMVGGALWKGYRALT